MKRFLALTTMLITLLTAGTAFASRVETKSYINTPASAISGPNCGTLGSYLPGNPPATDGSCFDVLPGDSGIDVAINDDHNSVVFGKYFWMIHIVDASGEYYFPSGIVYFCGSRSGISVPANAVSFAVNLAADGAITSCGGAGHIATTGTITATFS